MFGGIGTSIISLKRIGITMKKIIHVDHDQIANHVHRWNHDPTYADLRNENENHDDNFQHHIEHVYEYDRFEDIYNHLESFLEKHGRMYILVASLLLLISLIYFRYTILNKLAILRLFS
jgi:hypothetical protein